MKNKIKLEFIKETVSNGNLTVYNVPHIKHPSFEEYISAPVMVILSEIFSHMLRNEIKEIDYDKFLLERRMSK